MRSPALTLRLMPWFAAFSFTPIMVPTLVPFWAHHGLTTADIYLLQAAFAGAMVVLEVPTGMVADRMGKRTSLLIGQAFVAIGALAYALGVGFWSFLAAELTLALGMALLSGADSAILYDCLKSLGREAEYAAVEGKVQSVRFAVFAACNVLGGILATSSLAAPMWASVIGPVLALPLIYCFSEGQTVPARAGWREAVAQYREVSVGAATFISKHQLVRWYIVFQAILVASATWLLWSYQPYMELTGLAPWAVGLMFALYQLGAALFSKLSPWLASRWGEPAALLALAGLQAGTPLLMSVATGPAASLLVLGHQAVRGLFRPILSARILSYTRADRRATVLSMASLAGRLTFTATGPIIGWLAGAYPLRTALWVEGAVLALAFAFLAFQYRNVPAKYRVVKAGLG